MIEVHQLGRGRVLAATGILTVLVIAADWSMEPSLGVLYILPMMLGALAMTEVETVVFALFCALMVSVLDFRASLLDHILRFAFGTVAYTLSGLFVSGLVKNRKFALESFRNLQREQERSRELEEHLSLLVESSPAAIITADEAGMVLASNRAANELLLNSTTEPLVGKNIGSFISALQDALRWEGKFQGMRTAVQCLGKRANGEVFLANTWFSCYSTPRGRRMAAIVVDSSEEMRDREEEGLQQLIRGNRMAAAAVSHEVRNMCTAIRLAASGLREHPATAETEEFRRLDNMIEGLEKLAAGELLETGPDRLEAVRLQSVLDDLRIVIEQDWIDIDGSVAWEVPPDIPAVLADRHGLLQAFLNLAKNSHRAVRDSAVRHLRISASRKGGVVHVRFNDSGPGPANVDHLFRAFQKQSNGSGLGLYISRAMLRGYGGDVTFESAEEGTCFRVDILVA